MTQLCSVSLW